MASKSGGRINFIKLGMAVIDELTRILRDLLMTDVQPASIEKKMKSSKSLPRLRPEQELLVNKAKTAGYVDFDTTLLYTFLRNVCPTIPPPTNGWGNDPGPTDTTVGDDIERIRLIRNKVLGHIPATSVTDSDFQGIWVEIKAICQRMENYIGTGSTHSYVQNLHNIEMQSVDEELENKYTEKLQIMLDNEKEVTDMLQEMKQTLEDVKSDIKQLKGKRKFTAVTEVEMETIPEKRSMQEKAHSLLDIAYETLNDMVQSINENSTVEHVFEVCQEIKQYASLVEDKEESELLLDIMANVHTKVRQYAQVDKTTMLSVLSRFVTFVTLMRKDYKGKLEVRHSSLILSMTFECEEDLIRYQKDVVNGALERHLSECLLFRPFLAIFDMNSTDVRIKVKDITDYADTIGLTIVTETPTKQHLGCNQCAQKNQYYCKTCKIKLCSECKKHHESKHDVVTYSEKGELCNIHIDLHYILCCRQCEIPVCEKCITESHKNHVLLDIDDIFHSKKEEYDYSITKIKDELLPESTFLLEDVQSDSMKCLEVFAMMQLTMASKAQMLKDTIDAMLNENMEFLRGLQNSLISELQKQENLLKDHIEYLKNILDKYESAVNMSHATFILFQNEHQINKIEEIPILKEISFPSFSDCQVKIDDIAKIFGEIQGSTKPTVTRKVKHIQHIGKTTDILMKRIPTSTLKLKFVAPGVHYGFHVSPVTADKAWISDGHGNLVLTDTKGEKLNEIEYADSSYGCHTTSESGELIFLNKDDNGICKVIGNAKKPTIITKVPSNTVCSLYHSPDNGDILIGMASEEEESKVVRYKKTGEMVHQIQHDVNTGLPLYGWSIYVTENRKNKDICVSDYDEQAVVVVDKERNHRFSYTGHPPGADLQPMGISTDTQGHILVSDNTSHTIHMIDKDGNFLSFLLTETQGIGTPVGLSLDVKNNILWVGDLWNNKILVSRYNPE